MAPVRTIVIRNGRAWAGLESEPVPEGRHPRVAAMWLAQRLYGSSPFSLRELNAYNYSVTVGAAPAASPGGRTSTDAHASVSRPQECTYAPASALPQQEMPHP